MPDPNSAWYYDATSYLGVRQGDSVKLSWLGPNFSNSSEKAELSRLIRNECFRKFITKDTTEAFIQKYNLNDTRFWESDEWKRIERKELERKEFDKTKSEHPEFIYEPKPNF